jgi:hypothetical protein
MASNEEMAVHLLTCYDTIYMVLGESAPTFTNDAYVVRTFEMARAFGALALELRDRPGAHEQKGPAVLEAVLRQAATYDDSGAMTLYAMAMVVGPRLLVSLLDARNALVDDEALRELFSRGSQTVVAEIVATGESAKHQSPIEDPGWQAAALDLGITLDEAGNAESLGLSH